MSSELRNTLDGGEVLLEKAREILLKRASSDPLLSAESVDFGFASMSKRGEVQVGDSLSAVVARMRHLSLQFAVLLAGYEQLEKQRWREEHLQQAYIELLSRLADKPMWACEDDGTPSVPAACANLLSRCKWRQTDSVRGEVKIVSLEDWQGWSRPEHGASKLSTLIAGAKEKLSDRDFETLRILIICEIEDLTLAAYSLSICARENPEASQEVLEAEAKQLHAALRARVSRFRRERGDLLDDYRGEDEAA